MKRLLINLFILFSSLIYLSGCQTDAKIVHEKESDKIKVMTTIFPAYDFIRQIAGDEVELSMLIAPGAESHSFEPSPQDIIDIQNSDVFIYVGGESEVWVDKILNSLENSDLTIISLMDYVTLMEEEIVEGMEEDHTHIEDFEISDIQDRELSAFSGQWKPVLPYVEDGTLNEYMEIAADDRGETVEETIAYYLNKYATEFEEIEIHEDQVTMTSASGTMTGNYTYQGFYVNETETSKQVWYQFELANGDEEMPKRLVFNDHSIGTDTHTHGVAHFHLNYGNDSFEELIQNTLWSPSFYEIDATGEQILDVFLDHSHEAEMDEHVWTSIRNSIEIISELKELLQSLDSDNHNLYEQNATAYIEQLKELDEQYQEVVNQSTRNTLLFGDRFPFQYFARDYNLEYYAAFPGCSNETNASAGTVSFLIDKVREESIPVVLYLELSSGSIAKTIAEETNTKTAVFHSAHNVSKEEFESGVSYLDLMTSNLEVLKEVLN